MGNQAAQPPSAGPAEPAVPATTHHYVQVSEMPAEGVVEVDDRTDTESSYESEFPEDTPSPPVDTKNSGAASATTSVSSSVFSFTYANGRRYQSDRFNKADYFLPNDEREQNRLDLYHHIFLMLLGGKLYLAPLDNPQKVLDVGTGTGIWAIDFADLHPEAEVLGTDISPIQPSWVPTNAKFEIDDMEDEWTFKDNTFDYIHARSLSGSFQDWNRVLAQAFRTMTPGGYLEYQDYGCELFMSDGTRLDGTLPEHPANKYIFHINEAAKKSGRPLAVARGMADRMAEAGFVDIQQKTVIWPVGTWPKQRDLKELGRWGELSLLEGAYPFALMLLSREGWAQQDIKDMVDEFVSSVTKGSYYAQGWFVYGRKPEAEAA